MTIPAQVQRIKVTVAEHFGVTLAQLDSRDRSDHVAFPRQIAMTFTVRMLELSLPRAGQLFDRHHTSVMWAMRQVEKRVRTNHHDRYAVLAAYQKLQEART